jgi:hypothetical protein
MKGVVKSTHKGDADCQSSSAVEKSTATVPAITPELLAQVRQLERMMMDVDQVDIRMDHVIHAGMYARTAFYPPATMSIGSLMKRPTTLIVHGAGWLLVGDTFKRLDGYNVITGSVGRKVVLISESAMELTMIFPTSAKTVAEAEEEFTDDTDLLLSRRQANGTTTITGE